MKLVDLNPQWIFSGGEGITNAAGEPIPKREGVGIAFDCPCGQCGTRAFIPFTNPLDNGPPINPEHPHWNRQGDNFENLTLTPSIQRMSGCKWHGFITNGEAKSV